MGAIRSFIQRYPVAAIAVVVAVAGFGGWTLYQSRLAQPQGAQVLPPSPPRPGVSAIPPSPGTAVTPTAPSGAARGVTPTSPGGPASSSSGAAPGQTGPSQGAAAPGTTGEGRANPFQPLATPGGSGSNPAPGGGMPLPPVPPLAPATPGAPGPGAAPLTPPAPDYRLVGFLWGDTAVVILEDSQGSYIVGPGETVKPGIRVVSIDVRREVVRLDRNGTPVELTLLGAVRRSP